jgi:RNA-directed DNA polymerase
MEEGKVSHPDQGSPQGGVVSPLVQHHAARGDRQWCRGDGTMSNSVVMVRYADDMVVLARSKSEDRQAWERLQSQFAALRLVVNQEKSRLTTVESTSPSGPFCVTNRRPFRPILH